MGIEVIDHTGLPGGIVDQAALQIASKLGRWADGRHTTPLSMFTRGTFAQPESRRDHIASSRLAAGDDVVGTALEIVQGLAVDQVSWEAPEVDIADRWNDANIDVGMDFFVRSAVDELGVIGCVTVATWWGRSRRRPSGTGPAGVRRRRVSERTMPQKLTILAAEKVVKIPTFWGDDLLVWCADDSEEFEQMLDASDETTRRLSLGRFAPNPRQARKILEAGGNPSLSIELNPESVWQIRLPSAVDYSTAARTPLSRTFTWLEQKGRLMDADRASLIGAANFILVFTIGTDDIPASNEELEKYQNGLLKLAHMPVIIGDHRLKVSILTPDTTAVLNMDKHDVLNHRISAAVMGLPDDAMLPAHEDPEMAGRMMVSRIGTRRKMIKSALEMNLARRGLEAGGESVDDCPSFVFTPRQIPLVGVVAQLNALLAARSRRDLSRTSYLEGVGYDALVEEGRIVLERESGQDDAFRTQEPYSTPAPPSGPNGNGGQPPGAPSDPNNPGTDGGKGGRPLGDRTKPGQARPRPNRRN